MKESINYYYNFNIEEVENWPNYYRFKLNNIYYYLVPLNRSEQELEDLIEVSKELKRKGVECHDIIQNNLGKVVTNIYNINYILLRPIGNIDEEFDINDITKLNKTLTLSTNKTKLYRNSWAKLWSDKVDYFEYQIRELGKDKQVVLDSFSYYIGLAENAIAYVNSTTSKYSPESLDKICLSHRRIIYPNYKLNFLNPLSFIFDLEVRDYASYIISSFFNNEDALNILRQTLKINRFSIYSYQLLYARLLYPSYYFDIYEKVMNKEEDENKLITIIDSASNYEIFLKEAFNEITKYAPIERIEWILNKKAIN